MSIAEIILYSLLVIAVGTFIAIYTIKNIKNKKRGKNDGEKTTRNEDIEQ